MLGSYKHDNEDSYAVCVAKYRELDKEKPLWDQMGIADNEYANQPDIKAVIEKMIADDGDVMRPPADGKLRRTNNPDGTPLNIDLHLKDPTPIVAPTYRLNPTTAKCVTDNLEDMEAMGVVRRTEYSPWGFPEIPVRKPDGTWRSCSDLRKLNPKLWGFAYPLMTDQDVFMRLHGATRFTCLDMTKYYWTIGLTPAASEICTVRAPNGALFSYQCLPMGMKNSSAYAQCHIDNIMRQVYDGPGPFHGKVALECFCVAYQDDLTIYTDDANEPYHAHYVAWVIKQLHKYNLQVRADKCYWFQRHCNLLGHHIDKDGMHADPDKVKRIKTMPRPTTKAAVRSFLGFTGYLRKFMPNYAENTFHLTDLPKKEVTFGPKNNQAWTPGCEANYLALIEALSSPLVLSLPDWSKPFIMRTDASELGISYILLQDHDRVRKPVYYGGRKLHKTRG